MIELKHNMSVFIEQSTLLNKIRKDMNMGKLQLLMYVSLMCRNLVLRRIYFLKERFREVRIA